MGKGSNAQKKQTAQERNLASRGKTEEERRAAREKSTKDANAFMCHICRQTFMSNARPPLLYQHVLAKHAAGTDPLACFPVQLAGYTPESSSSDTTTTSSSSSSSDGKKASATTTTTTTTTKTTTSTASAPKKPNTHKKNIKDNGLDALLDAGLKRK